MNGYERILRVMREETKKNKNPFRIAEMTSETSCKIDSLELDKEDLYFSEHLLYSAARKVDIKIADGSIEDDTQYSTKLNAGDTVLLVRVSDERYVVLERMVDGVSI